MTTKTAQNWYESILDSQKKMAESLNETAKKWNSNEQVNQALENGSDFFKKWLNFQMDFAKNGTQNEGMKQAETAATESMNQWKSFYENLFKTQVENINNLNNQNKTMFGSWSSMFNQNPWMSNTNMDTLGNWNKSISDMYQSMLSGFNGNGSTKEVFEGLFNHTQSFLKFYEMWNPVFKNIQNNNFSADMLRSFIKPETYKSFMDSFFGFMPAGFQGVYQDSYSKFNEGMQSFGKQGMDMYREMTAKMMEFAPKGNNVFTEGLNNYNNIYSQMQNAFAPFSKLVAPNSFTKGMEASSEIMDMMNRYQIQNAQLQYMTYITGMKAMDQMGVNISEKLQAGNTYDSMQDLFKEWLNTSDKFFVELFETEDFSKIQAETSSLSLRLKHAADLQMEQMFSNVPVVPRSEMEELYKTIYELKKRVRTLEKEVENETTEEIKPAAKPAAKKASK
ncbi:MAG: hypothetical protein KG003_01665 [Bacteroidetes bacterium]|nr:hypothetical protein [Bacteroidota bacterium]